MTAVAGAAPEDAPADPLERPLARARALHAAGEPDQAWALYAELQAAHPDDARVAELRAALERADAAHRARRATRAGLLREVDAAWRRPSPAARADAPEAAPADTSGLRARLRETVIPRVSFERAPLSQVLDTLAELVEQAQPERPGLNLVLLDPARADPAVSLTLRGLSLERILDFATEAAGYEYDLTPDAVVVRPAQGPLSRLETAFFPLSRSTLIRLTGLTQAANAADPYAAALGDGGAPAGQPSPEERGLRDFLQRAGIPFDSVPGATLALADGQLILTHTPRHLDRARTLLRRYRETKQVEIEARFLEVEQGVLDELGVRWQVRDGGGASGGGTLGLAGTALAPLRTLAQASVPGIDPNRGAIISPGADGNPSELALTASAPSLPGSLNLGAGVSDLVSLSGVIGDLEVSAILRALSQRTGSDLLSAPKVTVLSGKTAAITVARELRYPTRFGDIDAQVGRGDSQAGSAGVAITAGTPEDFTVRNIGVEMAVTPTVEDDGAISLVLEPKVTEFEGFVEYGGQSVAIASGTTVTVPSGFFQPVFSVRTLKTEVTIWDGATVVLGGLTREEVRTVSDKVPVLGSLPLVGRLFRSQGETVQKRNLLIFVSANLISPGGSPAAQELPDVEPGAQFQYPEVQTPAGPAKRE